MASGYLKDSWPTWRLSWLESIFEFASVNMQETLWVGNAIGLQSDFVECVCRYFDDLGLKQGYGPFVNDGIVSKQEADVISKFHDMVDRYEPPNPDSDLAILRDTQWADVVAEAQRVWLALKVIVTSEKELARIAELEEQWGSFPG